MRRLMPLLAAAAAAMLLASCAGIAYTRSWTWNSTPLTDTLTVTDETFRLERSSSAGVAVFEGDLKQGDGDRFAGGDGALDDEKLHQPIVPTRLAIVKDAVLTSRNAGVRSLAWEPRS